MIDATVVRRPMCFKYGRADSGALEQFQAQFTIVKVIKAYCFS